MDPSWVLGSIHSNRVTGGNSNLFQNGEGTCDMCHKWVEVSGGTSACLRHQHVLYQKVLFNQLAGLALALHLRISPTKTNSLVFTVLTGRKDWSPDTGTNSNGRPKAKPKHQPNNEARLCDCDI